MGHRRPEIYLHKLGSYHLQELLAIFKSLTQKCFQNRTLKRWYPPKLQVVSSNKLQAVQSFIMTRLLYNWRNIKFTYPSPFLECGCWPSASSGSEIPCLEAPTPLPSVHPDFFKTLLPKPYSSTHVNTKQHWSIATASSLLARIWSRNKPLCVSQNLLIQSKEQCPCPPSVSSPSPCLSCP